MRFRLQLITVDEDGRERMHSVVSLSETARCGWKRPV